MEIKIKYFDDSMARIEKVGGEKSDWFDLRVVGVELSGERVSLEKFIYGMKYYKGEEIIFYMGVAMELPEGYEALVIPRSSTYDRWGFMQVNHIGLIDESYCGDNDEWKVQVRAFKDGQIKFGDRIAQFRVQEKMKGIEIVEVEELGNEDRGQGVTGRD